jgi:hypothetical protein
MEGTSAICLACPNGESCSLNPCDRAQPMPPSKATSARIPARTQGLPLQIRVVAAGGSGAVASVATRVSSISPNKGPAATGVISSHIRRRSSATSAALSCLTSGSFARSMVTKAFRFSGISGFSSLGGRSGSLRCFMETATGLSAV